jgi:cytochrome c peroxidase
VACRYKAAFGEEPSARDAEKVLVNVAKALAAYQETLVTGRTPFDDYRDALAARRAAARVVSVDAQRGSRSFSAAATASRATRVPISPTTPFVARRCRRSSARRRPTRAGRRVEDRAVEPFNLVGRYNDDPAKAGASTSRDAKLESHDARWRTPSLRNVAVTGAVSAQRHQPPLSTTVVRPLRGTVSGAARLRRRRSARSAASDLFPLDIDDPGRALLETSTDADGRAVPLGARSRTPACD